MTGSSPCSGQALRLGIDIGSTTAKVLLMNPEGTVLFSRYQRHNADIRATVDGILSEAEAEYGQAPLTAAITGSGGLGLAQLLGIEFVQEVVASKTAVEQLIPQTDVAIELGGEDAKIIYFTDGLEQRMNGSCAGGTGAFIDQMASLLDTDASGLNELARGYTTIHPIASRCGVFAKSDVQPLLNDGARREDMAASILQAVVNQTISGLACGRPIKGTVAFLGGPLRYLSELKKRFIETLDLHEGEYIEPPQAHLFVAAGAALKSAGGITTIDDIRRSLAATGQVTTTEVPRLDALFASETEREEFTARHSRERIPEANLTDYVGSAYLGIDAGSTTLKMALIDTDGRLLYSQYARNKGDVLGSALKELGILYRTLPRTADGASAVTIAQATVTGYGEALLQEALRVDSGEIETVAHLRGAQAIDPEVDFILDIGGQDMKCLHIKDGVIDHIMLNEACSSGCGSFIETFAESMGYTAAEFAAKALEAQHPVDLGSRCTVFMNSRVKQAQKEGAGISDISAGLSYSVIKNALFKVIKTRDPQALGQHMVVQGGTFLNDSVLRCFELLCGREAARPQQAGLMGAYGAALIARSRAGEGFASTLIGADELESFTAKQTSRRCKGCQNACRLVTNEFSSENGTRRRFITGNRCERGASATGEKKQLPNLLAYKNERLFSYEPLKREEAERPMVGIPRALNMYENYPFWFTFFTQLGFAVELSGPSSKKVYTDGMESMPSESVCYPAKLAHGHVMNLLDAGVDFVFLPCVRNEIQEDPESQNCFNCPIVSAYPEALRLNIDALDERGVPLADPYLPYRDDKRLEDRLIEVFKPLFAEHPEWKGRMPRRREIRRAIQAARTEDAAFKQDMHDAGARTLEWMEQTGTRGIVLAGRPYHADPEINHSLPEMINSLGFAVLTEDSVAWMARPERSLRAVDQWTYHSRLYSAAKLVTTRADLELVQLNSFGCGLDAITTDQVQEILEGSGRVYTVLKIDEVSNLGAARIRIRSLMAALEERGDIEPHPQSTAFEKVPYTLDMHEQGYTIIAPQMAPIHFELIEASLRGAGHHVVVLPADDPKAVDAGLRYVNNDICYPSILTTGQVMAAVESGEYDLDHLAVLIVQTGGGCRATNYISLIRKALRESGHPDIPVIALSFKNLGENNPGAVLTPELGAHAYFSMVLGDVLMQCLYRTRPYEAEPGSANRLFRQWMDRLVENLPTCGFREFNEYCRSIVHDFDTLPLANDRSKPRVGVVGEILVKYHPTANNDLVGVIEREGCEAVCPGFTDFFQYAALNSGWYRRYLDGKPLAAAGGKLGYHAIDFFRREATRALRESERFEVPGSIRGLADKTKDILQLCNCMGEGWLLTAEMIELIETGTPNIVICSPFACLPNHVVGKSVSKELRHRYPESNIVAVDYDPGASEVNQLNRIKLMISIAKERQVEAERPAGEVAGAEGTAGAGAIADAADATDRKDAAATDDNAAKHNYHRDDDNDSKNSPNGGDGNGGSGSSSTATPVAVPVASAPAVHEPAAAAAIETPETGERKAPAAAFDQMMPAMAGADPIVPPTMPNKSMPAMLHTPLQFAENRRPSFESAPFDRFEHGRPTLEGLRDNARDAYEGAREKGGDLKASACGAESDLRENLREKGGNLYEAAGSLRDPGADLPPGHPVGVN